MADSRTDLRYGGVTLRNVLTRSFEQDAVYDESNTDLERHRVRIHVASYVSSIVSVSENDNRPGAFPQVGNDLASSYQFIKSKLLTPRQSLVYSVGGKPLITVDGNSDVNNGPKPISCNIVQVASDNLFRIEFIIECSFVDCPESKNSQGVLNNRGACRTTSTTTGTALAAFTAS
jgi:hypothetical protein